MTPHQKIIRAAERMTGVKLTAKEVAQLATDTAIRHCAENDDTADALLSQTKESA